MQSNSFLVSFGLQSLFILPLRSVRITLLTHSHSLISFSSRIMKSQHSKAFKDGSGCEAQCWTGIARR